MLQRSMFALKLFRTAMSAQQACGLAGKQYVRTNMLRRNVESVQCEENSR
jgi:hypothetical protein